MGDSPRNPREPARALGAGIWGSCHPTRLGLLYPKYIGKNEDVLYCPDARRNALLSKGDEGGPSVYPWSNYGKHNLAGRNWAYGSYGYRPRFYWDENTGEAIWVAASSPFKVSSFAAKAIE